MPTDKLHSSNGPIDQVSIDVKSKEQFSANCDKLFNRFKFSVYAEVGAKSFIVESHNKRIQNIRKELNFIKETEWCYEPVEKLIGQL